MKRLAGVDGNDIDDDVDQDDVKEDDVTATAENLRVFCVSSADYLKLKGKVHDTPAVSKISINTESYNIDINLKVFRIVHWASISLGLVRINYA